MLPATRIRDRRDLHGHRLPASITPGVHAHEPLVDAASLMLQSEATPSDGGRVEEPE